MNVDPNHPFRHLCPEADTRDRMDDSEFWDHVFNRAKRYGGWNDIDETFEDFGPDILSPCPMCGDTGACGYDQQGRPWIHVIGTTDE